MEYIKKLILNKKLMIQIWVIFFCLCIFAMSATFSPIANKSTKTINIVLFDLVSLLPFFATTFILAKSIQWNRAMIKQFFFNYRFLIIVVAISTLLRLIQFNTLPRWDSDTYLKEVFKGCGQFDFTLKSYLLSFRLCSHPSLGYAFFLAMGAFCFPDSIIGVNIINLILVEFAIIFVYKLLQKIFPKISPFIIALATLLFSMEPMFLGTFYGLSLDFGIGIFFIYILFFNSFGYNLLFFFFSCILVQTKEVGAIMILGFFIGYAIISLLSGNGSLLKRLTDLFLDKTLIGGYFAGLIMFYYLIWVNTSPDIGMWSSITVGENGGNDNYFGFNILYIMQKFKTAFVLNFYWIVSVIIIIGIFLSVKRGILRSFFQENRTVFAGGISIFFLLIFNSIYITINNSRYILVIAMFAVFCMLIIILHIRNNNKKYLLLSFISLLFLAQAFVTIDPITLFAFDKVKTSDNTYMIHTEWGGHYSPVLDIGIYNNQTTYLDKAFDNILRENAYDGNMDIIIGGEYSCGNTYEGVAYHCFEGHSLDFYWDLEKECRTFVKNNSCIDLNTVYQKDLAELKKSKKLKKQAVLLVIKQFYSDEPAILKNITKYYDIGERKQSTMPGQGAIYYYNLERLS